MQQLLALQYGRQGRLAGQMTVRCIVCQSFEQSLALWKELESKAAVDAENRTQRSDMEKALARCQAGTTRGNEGP